MKTLSFILLFVLLGIGSAKAQFYVSILHRDTVLCQGQTINTDYSLFGMDGIVVGNGTPPYTAQWLPAVGVSNPNILKPILTPQVSTVYTLTVTDANGLIASRTYDITVTSNYDSYMLTDFTDGACTTNGTGFVYTLQGVPPMTYLWSNDSTDYWQENLLPGVYTITGTTGFGCTGTISDVINPQKPYIDMYVFKHYNSCVANVGPSLHNTVTQPCQYSWNTGATIPYLNFVSPGNYALTMTDANGCVGMDSTIVRSPLKVDSVIVTNASCNTGSVVCAYASQGEWPYTYTWYPPGPSSTSSQSCKQNLAAGTYNVVVRDTFQCSVQTTFTVQAGPNPLNMHITPDTAIYITPDSLVMNVTGGTPPYRYLWYPSMDSSAVFYPDSSTFSVWAYVFDSFGCVASDTIRIGCYNTCVWPGDANYDGEANNTDLLYIGLGYGTWGSNGYPYQFNINWEPRQAIDWDSVTIDTVNFKHMDCDGNGMINADDTTAILVNYGLQHPRSGGEDDWRANTPPLQPIVLNDTVAHGDTLIVDLVLGDVLNPAEDVYGIAFTINYNPITVDTTKTRVLFGNSWLGNATDKISITKDFTDVGQIKCGITRIDHANRSGNGAIGIVKYVITTDNINGKDLLYFTNEIWISDITAMDRNGNRMDINAGRDSAVIEYEITGINDIAWADKINMYPNPTQNILNISSPQVMVNTVAITNVLGERVMAVTVNANKATINTENLQPGIYFTELYTDKGTFTKRLVITR